MNEQAGPRIIRADRALRTLTLVGVVLVLLAGVLALVYTESFLHDVKQIARESPGQAAARVGLVLKLIAAGAAVIPIAVGAYLTRVALRKGSMVVNSSQGGGSKDTWVVDLE